MVAITLTRFTLTRITSSCSASMPVAIAAPITAELTSHRDVTIPLSFHPDLAVDEILFFPDRNERLQTIDAFERRIKRGPAVGRGDNHCNARLADQQPPQAMDHGDALDRVRARDLHSDFGHHVERHWLVAFVIQAARPAAFGV